MAPIDARVLQLHPLNRWMLPLGFVGLAAIVASMLVLPREVGATFFWTARIVFVAAYVALLSVGMSRRSRTSRVTVDAGGLRDDTGLLVARADVERVLRSGTTIELRGRTTLWLELRRASDADQLVAALDPDRRGAPLTCHASTTPAWLAIASWMGIPIVLSIPLQLLVMAHVEVALIVAVVSPGVIVWLVSTVWFARRRTVTVTATELLWPRLFSRGEESIGLDELASIVFVDAVTLRLTFRRRRARSLKLYDPSLLDDLVVRLRERAPRAAFVDRRPAR